MVSMMHHHAHKLVLLQIPFILGYCFLDALHPYYEHVDVRDAIGMANYAEMADTCADISENIPWVAWPQLPAGSSGMPGAGQSDDRSIEPRLRRGRGAAPY